MKRIEDIKNFDDIDTYYEISSMVEEIFGDRVEAHKHLVTANKEIERLNKTIKIARHNILSDISMIKNEKMSKKEIINRLQSTLSLIAGSDKECEKIKVGNAEVEKANYDYFLFMYEKMPKEYVVADLVSKCEDYGKLYKNYEMKDLQIEEIRKDLINQDKYIAKLKEEYTNQLQQKENIIKEVREILEKEYVQVNNKEYNLNWNDLENIIKEISNKVGGDK